MTNRSVWIVVLVVLIFYAYLLVDIAWKRVDGEHPHVNPTITEETIHDKFTLSGDITIEPEPAYIGEVYIEGKWIKFVDGQQWGGIECKTDITGDIECYQDIIKHCSTIPLENSFLYADLDPYQSMRKEIEERVNK